MAQYARPDSDVSIDDWVTQSGGTTNLYTGIDESSADDADYIKLSLPTIEGDTYICTLSDVTDPVSSSDHVLTVRLRKTTGAGAKTLNYILKQGSTTIKSGSFSTDATDNVWATRTATLSGGEADAITDYSDLRLHLQGTGSTTFHVSQAFLEVPDVVAPVRRRGAVMFGG